MPELYFDTDRRQFFSAPQFNIMNHRYRGVRESCKINLEINQLNYSFQYLYSKHNTFVDDFEQNGTILLEGNENDPSPVIDLIGLESLVSRCDSLDKRIEALED